MSVLEHVAENVRRLRAAAGLSQQALAEAADVSRRMLVGIESGDANVSLNTLDRIAEALQVSFADLVKAPANDLRRIEALAADYNTPSVRLLQKFGMQLEGVIREHYVVDGVNEDSVLYSIIRPDYDRVKEFWNLNYKVIE